METKERLDLALINPGDQKQVYQKLSDTLSAIEPPLWVGLMATFARNHGLSVKIIDAEAEGFSPEEVGKKVAIENPVLAVVVAFGSQPSASTQKMTAAGITCKKISEYAGETSVMLSGVHVSALPERTLKEEAVDFVCEGEGPYTILELMPLLQKGGASDFSKVPGLWYRGEQGEILSNDPAPLIDDLDKDLPSVAWDLLPMDKYRAHNWHCFGHLDQRQPYAVIYTTLGCPFKCSFCCINAPFGKPSYRYRSPEKVVEEIDLLVKNYGVRNIKFIDEMFVLTMKHVGAICDLLAERDYRLNIWAYARVDTINADILVKLKKAGVNWLALGIESASSYVRDGVQKKTSLEEIKKTVRMIQAADINIIGNYIFGLPDDTIESMQETLDLAIDLNCEFANLYCAMAYPGSGLYQMAVDNGWRLPDRWSAFSQHARDTLPLPTKTLEAGQVLAFRDSAFNVYFSNPEYLESVETKFGVDTRKHIEDMASFKIQRENADTKSTGKQRKVVFTTHDN